MGRRQSWNSLSDSYRNRLERGGITKRGYESGQSLKRARGHEKTPERPQEATRKPGDYIDYISRRDALINEIQRFKRDRFGTSPRWNNDRSRGNISKDPMTGKQRGIKELEEIRQICSIAEQDRIYDWHQIIDMDGEFESAFYYG